MLPNSVLTLALRNRHEQKWKKVKDCVGLFKMKYHLKYVQGGVKNYLCNMSLYI